ncbi:exopolysaccharide biosynthesis protein [Amycolatopsis sp. MJM2582]|uniref:Wzz/FepE/Etk N-terminal domain-containing protein n=1 Tax=Amycolatopsis sp. MJM2582 TaxID=1427749 RepID=UPI00050895EB|nr:Wzz/FepE/Etk N-terminal domain-containing protein [Amycolatopsis sp. MJM2582]KFZ82957.1 exopolysaccharide biosynthesis protein [Amycolatopsis sp. MJM2582]
MTTAEKEKSEPLIDLQRLVVSVRRRRRLWLATALFGLIAGALVALLLPSPPTAVAKILVIHADDSPSDSGTLMETDVAVLQTTKIAGEALKKLNSTQPAEEFLKDYTGLGVTNNVLQVTVKGKDNADAVARAQALSDAFITEYVARNQAAAAAEQKALIDQRNQAQTELATVQNDIVTEEAKRNPNPAQLERMYSRRAELTSKISDYDGRAQEAGIGTPKVGAGTQIVDAPRIVPKSFLKSTGAAAGIGAVLGLLLGLVLAAISSVVKDRPVLRRELSWHLGASVLAQLPKPRRWWRKSRAVAERERVAATLLRTIGEHGTVSLLDLGARATTAALAVDIANGLAEKGPVTLVDELPKADLRALAGEGKVRVLGRDEPKAPGECRVGVGSIEPGTAWTDLEHLGAETILVVRAGRANTEWLHTVARQLAERRIPIIGIVVVDPDPRDHTDGTLWDGLHTALRGRGAETRAALAGPEPVESPEPVKAPEPPPVRRPRPRFDRAPQSKPVEMFPDDEPTVRRLAVAPPEPAKPVDRVLEPAKDKKPVRRRPPTPYKRPEELDNADQPTKRFSPVSPDNAEAL